MAKSKLTVTLPDGTTATRTTARTYTHAVTILVDEKWLVKHWCSRQDLAEKQADWYTCEARVIAVTARA